MIVLYTYHITELQRPDSRRRIKLVEHLEQLGAPPLSTTIVTVEERLRGYLSTINRRAAGNEQVAPYAELLELMKFFSEWLIMPFDQTAAQQFHDLKARKIRIGTMDLKIAAIVLALGATLYSANLRDFRQVPGLSVEDWLSGE
jgi:tRNA(fMet)-specific endonuclease VapC